MSARSGAAPAASQANEVATARTSRTGTKTATARSATACRWGLRPCASSTARTMPASTVASPTRLTSTVSAPYRFTVPPMTCAPVDFSTGRRLAGDQRFVHLRDSRHHLPVDRDPLAGNDLDPVAGTTRPRAGVRSRGPVGAGSSAGPPAAERRQARHGLRGPAPGRRLESAGPRAPASGSWRRCRSTPRRPRSIAQPL